MSMHARSIGHRTLSTNLQTWVALSGLLIGTASLAACGPADGVVDSGGSAVSVPDSNAATQADAGAAAPDPGAPPVPGNGGERCAVDADCLTGSCITSYRDHDGDGYGNAMVARCEVAPAAGYVLTGGDCCDSDPATHPGVISYSAIADACEGFDRNCDGKAERDDGSSMTCGCIGIAVGKLGDSQICTACR